MDSVEKCKQTLLDLGHVEFTFEDFLGVCGASRSFCKLIQNYRKWYQYTCIYNDTDHLALVDLVVYFICRVLLSCWRVYNKPHWGMFGTLGTCVRDKIFIEIAISWSEKVFIALSENDLSLKDHGT